MRAQETLATVRAPRSAGHDDLRFFTVSGNAWTKGLSVCRARQADFMATHNIQEGYKHERVHHAQEIYGVGDAHTNTIEGFWSLVKRGISGVYHSVSTKHLQGYLNEYVFRYNHRKDERPMCITMLGRVSVAR